MIAIPAVDVRGGACVQPTGASDREHVPVADPLAVARSWARLGFHHLHVVDMDAATGRGSNLRIVRDLLFDRALAIQVGGGVQTADGIELLLGDGARAVVLGTKAVEEPDWIADMSTAFPGELIVATDIRGRQVVTRSWSRSVDRHVLDFVEELNALPLAGVMVTAVHLDGQMRGVDLPLMEDVAELSTAPVYACGIIDSISDLRSLADRGVAAVILGMGLYTGRLDARAVAEEFFE